MSEEKNLLDRLKDERDALMEKHIQLTKFLMRTDKDNLQIPQEEWFLLRLQESVMKEYGMILERRLKLLIARAKVEDISDYDK